MLINKISFKEKVWVMLSLGRISNLPTVFSNILCGGILASGSARQLSTLFPVMLVGIFFYVAGMYLNDAFDRDFDRKHRPERPIPQGLVSARLVFYIGAILIFAGIGICAYLSIYKDISVMLLPVAIGLSALIVFYNWHHKQNPIAPYIMALCRILLYFLGGFYLVSSSDIKLYWGSLCLFSYLSGLTLIAKSEYAGRKNNFIAICMLFLPSLFWLLGDGVIKNVNYLNISILIIFIGWTSYCLSFLKKKKLLFKTVIGLIAGISLLDALLVSSSGNVSPEILIIMLMCFLSTLLLQRYVKGT
ncbi:MAG: UbiA family prenyltransferase [Bdellovibrionota bacterium]